MKPVHVVLGAASALGLLLVPVSTATATGALPASSQAVAPDDGTWHLSGDIKGSFHVTSHHTSATDFHGTIGSSAETACGTGPISVKGSHSIRHFSGYGDYGRYNFYLLAKGYDGDDPEPVSVTVVQNGHHVDGHLDVYFPSAGHTKGSKTTGDLTYHGQACDLEFDIDKG